MAHFAHARKFSVACVVAIGIAIGSSALIGGGRTSAAPAAVHFEDITRAAGIHFVHNNGAFGKKWLPETMGPGVALHRL